MTRLIGLAVARDEAFLHYVLGRRHPNLDRAVRFLTHAGDAAVVVPSALGFLYLQPDSPAPRIGLFALALSHMLVQALKRTISRPRPLLPVGVASLIEPPDRFSFPSGHAAASLSVALGLALTVPLPLAIPMLLLAASVGVSRCYLGVHYPGDVIVGWLLALAGVLLGGGLF